MRPRARTSRRIAVLLAAAAALAATAPAQPSRRADHVVVVMLDGTRPDTLGRARAPTIHGLAVAGSAYTQARTSYPSQTRVAFVTLPTGVYPEAHGIVGGNEVKDAEWRTVPMGDEDPIAAQALVPVPTMFEEAAAAGLTSLYAAMKGYELVGARGATWTINGKKTLDPAMYATRYRPEVSGSAALAAGYKQMLSRQLLDQTLALFRERRPNLVVLNLGAADYAAHSFGPESAHYRATLEYQDALVADLLRALDELGVRARTALVFSSDHGFSQVGGRLVAPYADGGGKTLEALAVRGIEHLVTNTGGSSLGVYVRDKARVAEAAAALRAQAWCESLYCEDARAGCDRTLRSLRAFFPGRSPDLMVDLDDDAMLNSPMPGQHGSLRTADMRIPLVLSGAGVAPGRVFGPAELVDVAPTVLRLLGVTPTRMRPAGRVLEEALVP